MICIDLKLWYSAYLYPLHGGRFPKNKKQLEKEKGKKRKLTRQLQNWTQKKDNLLTTSLRLIVINMSSTLPSAISPTKEYILKRKIEEEKKKNERVTT